MKEKKNISIVIPNFNGTELLKANLPVLIDAMGSCGLVYEIIIADDASTDASAQFIKDSFPQVILVELKKNRGFSATVNAGAAMARYDLLFLINSDISPGKDFLMPLLDYFRDERTFAVSNKAVADARKALTRSFKINFEFGFFREKYTHSDEPGFAFGASGGHGLFDRKKFLELGGFDESYSPFYYEDADLSYRAWKRGYKVYYEPRSLVCHGNKTTIGKTFGRHYIRFIFERNRLMFLWKNLTDADFLMQHLLFLPFHILKDAVRKPLFLFSFFAVLVKLPQIVAARRKEKKFIKYGDRQVLGMIKQPIKNSPQSTVHGR